MNLRRVYPPKHYRRQQQEAGEVVLRGQDCWRKSDDMIEVTNIFLGDERVQFGADEIAHEQRPELVDRLGFHDPKL